MPAAPTNVPRDRPATVFQADPFVKELLEQDAAAAETYGIVLVTGWPAPEAWQRTYTHKVRPALAACFPQDVVVAEQDDGSCSSSTVYLYPPQALHVTVATFWSIHQTLTTTPPLDTAAIERDVKAVVEQAWRRYLAYLNNNNNQAGQGCDFRLEIESAQIGTKAGILLWKETSGHLAAFRRLLQETCDEEAQRLSDRQTATDKHSLFMSKLLSELSIPSIVHSTVVRFADTPQTDGATVQEIFGRTVVPCLATALIPEPWRVDSVTLALERRPYMHIPKDETHVLWTSND
jgi:hypothetical protein